MKLLVTGANGFLGREVVRKAVEAGHTVKVLIRPASRTFSSWWETEPRIEVIRADLRDSLSVQKLPPQIDGVIHLAAVKSGDLYAQIGGTVIGTENLLKYISTSQVKIVVAASSFSVYEYVRRRTRSNIDENSPIAENQYDRDEYCQTKLMQEELLFDYVANGGVQVIVLRPGVIIGKDNLWTARLGMQLSEHTWIRIGGRAQLPVTYVENCAEAFIKAAEYQGKEKSLILNVVDSQNPSQRQYLRFIISRLSNKPRIITIPWPAMRLLARAAWIANAVFFGGEAKVPGLFIPSRLHARCKPFLYSNSRIQKVLGWTPKFSWQEAVERVLQ